MCLNNKESKLNISYPAITDEKRTLLGVFSIEYWAEDLDEIRLGKHQIGYVQAEEDVYSFYPHTDINKPYPARQSYEAVWQDIITHIANDLELAIEFTIKVQQKVKGDTNDNDNQ